jgi:hypothetical protein
MLAFTLVLALIGIIDQTRHQVKIYIVHTTNVPGLALLTLSNIALAIAT